MTTATDPLDPAIALREAGRPDEARDWLERHIAAHPDDVEALALLGHVHLLRKDIDAAQAVLGKALTIDRARPSVLRNGARLLSAQGDPSEAAKAAVAAYQADPGHPESAHLLAISLLGAGQADQAAALFDQAIAARPSFAEALAQRAMLRARRGDHAGARADADAAYAVKPFLASYCVLAATMRHQAGDRDAAIAAMQAARAIDPGHVGYMVNLGEYLRQADRAGEAVTLLEQAVAAAPTHAAAWANLGTARQHGGDAAGARDAYARALAIDPGLAVVANNLGGLERDQANWDAALAHFDQALAARPDFPEAQANRATALVNLARFDEAEASFTAALAARPDLAEARWGKGAFDLLRGDYAAGWEGYEWRWRMERISTPRRSFDVPLWTGAESVAGRTILVHWEQGLGDTIQFSRYALLLAEQGARVLFAPQQKLQRLLAGLVGDAEIVDLDFASLLGFDAHIPLLSLPHALGTRIGNVPGPSPYLLPDPEAVASWRSRLGDQGFRVGVCWRGGDSASSVLRSFPPELLSGIAAIPGLRLISLQKDDSVGLKQSAALGIEHPGADFDEGPDAFVDSAAVIASCDLVVSCDTSIAHLAGALGVPTFLALRHVPDWRWMLGREDSPWYPSARLFRQPAHGDWSSVFAAIEQATRAAVAAGTVRA